jgi:hypothetical protein
LNDYNDEACTEAEYNEGNDEVRVSEEGDLGSEVRVSIYYRKVGGFIYY